MGYIHKGRLLINGAVDPVTVPADTYELTVRPEDDGLQIVDFTRGDFEWWYFDINDQISGCFIKIVVHIGTDPLRTRVFPQLAISVNTREKSESFFHPFSFSEMHSDTTQCNISVGNKIKIRTEFRENAVYLIEADVPGFKCNFRFKGYIEGWKPFGEKILYQSGNKKGDFSWVIPIPKAQVDGYFIYENKKYDIINATGYHDHNYIKVDRKYPLYLDAMAIKWYWGKFYADRFTGIFADVYSVANRTLSLMVAENDKIIHSSNNLIECSVSTSGYDNILRVKYPASLTIKSLDEHFPFRAELEFYKILDRKDLLEGVNPVLKYLINKLVAKPAYHGISSRARLEINNIRPEGYGNFESMVFRNKCRTDEMNTAVSDHKIDKPLGPSGVFAGYSLIAFGIIGAFYSLIGLIVVVPGCLLAFTYDGTRIDFKSRRIKNYTSLFGLFKIGKWYSVDDFTKFRIYQSKRTYTSYSRANIPLNLKTTDIRLSLLNDDGSLKITVNRFNSFESARKEMSELIRNLQINELKEWI